MKKLLITLLFVFITAGLCFAGSSMEEIKQDLGVYNTEINPKIVDGLSKIEQEMVEIDNVLEGKSKKNIQTILKVVENQVNSIEKHMKEQASKIKTPEVKRYHDVTLEYIKARYAFLKDVVDTYVKKGKIEESDQEKLVKKYSGTFEKLNKENAEALQVLMNVLHVNLTDNTTSNNANKTAK